MWAQRDRMRLLLGTKSALARVRNLFPVEQLAPGRAPGPGEDGSRERRTVKNEAREKLEKPPLNGLEVKIKVVLETSKRRVVEQKTEPERSRGRV